MQKLGLHDIDIRMNNKVMYVNPDIQDYEEKVQDFIEINEWDKSINISDRENLIETCMNQEIDRVEAEDYIKIQSKIKEYFRNTENRKSFLKVQGLSKLIISELEKLGKSKGYKYALLETGIKQYEAINLYRNTGYEIIENFEPYKGNANSVCMEKKLYSNFKSENFDVQ